jgi:hypothetical protein
LIAFSLALIAEVFVPYTPIHSHEVTSAYAAYRATPSDASRRAYEETVDRVNRPLHILQYVSGISGVALLAFVGLSWKQNKS